MARPSKKNIYDRINDKKNEILKAEEYLVKLNNELQALISEKETLEMKLLLQKVKEAGLDIEQALNKLSNK